MGNRDPNAKARSAISWIRHNRELPHAFTRVAIFWILFAAWPSMRIARHVWHPAWLGAAEDVCAVMTSAAVLTGKYLFQNAQRDVYRRLNEVERVWRILGNRRQRRRGLEVIRSDRG